MTELNNMFVKIDDRRRVSAYLSHLNADIRNCVGSDARCRCALEIVSVCLNTAVNKMSLCLLIALQNVQIYLQT